MVITGEDDLIRRAQAGDAEAFCQLAKHYERRIYTLALHYCRDAHDAEDLSQDVWLKAFKALGGFRAEASFYTWLRRIMIHTFLNDRRAMTLAYENKRTPIKFDSLDEMVNVASRSNGSFASETEQSFHQKILAGRVISALCDLTPQQRLIFLLKHEEGMTYQEISETLGCSTGSIKKSLFRAVLKLRLSLGVGVEEAEGEAVPAGESR